MIRCMWGDCTKEAWCLPRLEIPAEGWPVSAHRNMVMEQMMPVCRECFETLTPAVWLGEELNAQANNLRQLITILTRGKQPPDFDRAVIYPSKLSDAAVARRWEEFAARGAEKEPKP